MNYFLKDALILYMHRASDIKIVLDQKVSECDFCQYENKCLLHGSTNISQV